MYGYWPIAQSRDHERNRKWSSADASRRQLNKIRIFLTSEDEIRAKLIPFPTLILDFAYIRPFKSPSFLEII